MITIKLRVFIVVLAFSMTLLSGKSLVGDDKLENDIYEISRDMGDHFIRTADYVDSLQATLSDEKLEQYEYIFKYTYAYVAFMKGHLGICFNNAESSLEHFMYTHKDEWACRSLMLIAHVAESKRLMPEAATVYQRVVEISEDPFTLASAYLNMAKVRKSMGLDWEESLSQGFHYGKLTGDPNFAINAEMFSCWLHPNSEDLLIKIPLLGQKFHELEHYSREADAYKCLVKYYINVSDYQNALVFADKSIDTYNMEERPAKGLLTSIHFLKGNIYLLLNDKENAYIEYNIALDLNLNPGDVDGNYNLYKSMYGVEFKEGNYKKACFFLEKAIEAYRYLSVKRMEYYINMVDIFKKMEIIEDELLILRKESTRKIVFISFLLICFFTIIIIWLLSLKRHFEKISVDMEDKNLKLKEEAGELLVRANRKKLANKILESQSDVERKIEKFLLHNKVLPDVIKNKYAETMLRFDVKFPMLSDSEKRYAVMFALELPPKTIAEFLNVKTETVAQYRNRLRKKLGISNTQTDLNHYLRSFVEE